MDCKQLVAEAKASLLELSELWNEIGVTADEQSSLIEKITERTRATFSDTIAAQEQLRNTLQKEIEEFQSTIAAIQLQLQRQTDNAIADNTGASLRVQRDTLKARMDKLKQVRDAQQSKCEAALQELHALWEEMGIDTEAGFKQVCYDITDARYAAITQKTIQAKAEKQQREARREEICDAMKAVMTDMALLEHEKESLSPLDLHVIKGEYDSIAITSESLSALDARHEQLVESRRQRKEALKELAEQITSLWTRLFVPKEEQQEFLRQHEGLSIATLSACEAELARLLERKKASLVSLIKAARERLEELWEETLTSQEERKKFTPAFADMFTDESLDSHEREIARVEAKAEAMKPLLKMVNDRQAILDQKESFALTANDPNRFRIPGRLLEEEKFRRRLTTVLPKIEKKLREQIPVWEKEHGDFCIQGTRFLETLSMSAAEHTTPVRPRVDTRPVLVAKTTTTEKKTESSSSAKDKDATSRATKSTPKAKVKTGIPRVSTAKKTRPDTSENNSRQGNTKAKPVVQTPTPAKPTPQASPQPTTTAAPNGMNFVSLAGI